jgi:hypothetical protein
VVTVEATLTDLHGGAAELDDDSLTDSNEDEDEEEDVVVLQA